ncbi:hypothetical protein Cgig2_004400 [Carnegiea gigantea]|uniref:Inositol-pentakisphosphate 2-kinase n=1 Tax=Carnegiea gigantea TaxID=171969 RepID=A0A9Q1JRU4_9CARY|nr:hypothetical protein Cgig2_004400 [Carnegiea gigantea]
MPAPQQKKPQLHSTFTGIPVDNSHSTFWALLKFAAQEVVVLSASVFFFCCWDSWDFLSFAGIRYKKGLMMELILEEEDARDWTYRGEGAANLVLAYTGSSPAFIGKVIRVQKVGRNGSKCENGHAVLSKHERIVWKDAGAIVTSPTKEVAQQLYVQCVMIPLLGSEYVDAGIRILVSRKFLESIERNVLCQRPGWRVSAAKVLTCSDSVLLMSDHSLFPYESKGSLALIVRLEVVKQEHLKGSHAYRWKLSYAVVSLGQPKCGFLPSSRFIADENAIKKNVTRFKMHQFLKLQQLQISQMSEYDPLDLFSGSRERIQKAIKALFATPQNNLRVFLNGSLIYGGLEGDTQEANLIKAEAFEDYLKSFIHAEDDKEMGKYNALHSVSFDESVKVVKDYLIATTAKDCSLMISFRPRDDSDRVSAYRTIHLESTQQTFEVKAHFIDLDLKSLKKMEYYYELDQKIVNCYKQMVKVERGPLKAGSIKGYETGIEI